MKTLIVLNVMLACTALNAQKKLPGTSEISLNNLKTLATGCAPARAIVDLDINNVRATLSVPGIMWNNLSGSSSSKGYEVPKNSKSHSLFAGALWIGGKDAGGNVKVAAMTYRQLGNDFWPGPVDTVTATTDSATCKKYDQLFKINRKEVEDFVNGGPATPAILSWPGNGDPGKNHAKYLAPFYDKNVNGTYEPALGEYPGYDFGGSMGCENKLLGDQTIWWVFNDVGNIHGETRTQPIGLEIQAQAFAYATNDDLDNTSFYKYKMINRSSFRLDSTYFGIWCDADLGSYTDDYVGCDVKRGIGYCYNGDEMDGSGAIGQYGLHPPAIGIDFIGGPLADAGDGVDNDRDSIIDEPGERIIMSDFMYYDGGPGIYFNPISAVHYYYYLKSLWGDGSKKTYGGTGHGSGQGRTSVPCKFFFPGNSDPYGWGTNGVPMPPWDEITSGNTPADRRFIMSAGQFTMQPGAVQYITTAVVWARDINGNNIDAIKKMQEADDVAQTLFDNCFTVLPCSKPREYFTISQNKKRIDCQYHLSHPDPNYTYLWNFGDSTISTLQNPSHIYSSSGIKTVCLTITNKCGSTIAACKQVLIPVITNLGVRIKRVEGQGNGGQVLDFTTETIDEILNSPSYRVLNPVYEVLQGPVEIYAYDTTKLPKGEYMIRLNGTSDSSTWKIYRIGIGDTVFSDSTIGGHYQQVISKWGIAVKVNQIKDPGYKYYYPDFQKTNGFLEANISFAEKTRNWLSGIQDTESGANNWIRSGTAPWDYIGYDDNQDFEKMIGGTWAPYRLCSVDSIGPVWNNGVVMSSPSSTAANRINFLASVDIIITPDQTKWSRCPVLDASVLSNNGSYHDMRKDLSVDKNGNPDGTGTGMGWFPGYAVNLETGERLNIAFAEDTTLASENGDDMKWNPTSNAVIGARNVWGGKHTIIVFNHNGDERYSASDPVIPLRGELKSVPRYDEGLAISKILNVKQVTKKRDVFRDAMWVSIPLLKPGHTLLESEVKIRLRVAKPYRSAYSAHYGSSFVSPPSPSIDTAAIPQNKNFPMYEFDAGSVAVIINNLAGKSSGQVYLFPNPFNSSATLIFKNPDKEEFSIQIYSLEGKCVRRFENVKSERVSINKENLKTGIYLYKLQSKSGKQFIGKMVIE